MEFVLKNKLAKNIKTTAAVLIIISIGILWFMPYKLTGFSIMVLSILLYGASVKIAYSSLMNGGEKRIIELLKLDTEEIFSEHSQEYDSLIEMYLSVREISGRLPSEVKDYKLEGFANNIPKIKEIEDKKDDWIIKQITKEKST